MTRLRKATRGILKEGQRRSPRICALESNAASASANNNNGSKNDGVCMRRRRGDGGSAYQTRARKRTKLRSLQQLATNNSSSPPNQVQGGGGCPSFSPSSYSSNSLMRIWIYKCFFLLLGLLTLVMHLLCVSDQPSQLPSTTFVPEKRILQLVLDTLQRRDSYEIFAEPVDPNEVENYYEIIEEPMDFGTMRAKLHEGMYKSLEQFEHDVFLIFNNAMHFNSAGTVYFRQGRAISEVAKKVFDLLRSDPEKFELEFSERRRKVGRRKQGELRENSRDMKSSEISIGTSRATSNRKSLLKAKVNAIDVDATDVEFPTVDSRRYSYYRPLSLGDEDEGTVYGKLKQLEYVNNEKDVGYRDSLMLFVKDLGPSVQNMAKRKLVGCDIHTAASPSSTSAKPSYMNHNTDNNNNVGGSLIEDTQTAIRHHFTSSDHGSKQVGNNSTMMVFQKSKLVNQEQLLLPNVDNFQPTNNNVFKSKPWPFEGSDFSCFGQHKRQVPKLMKSDQSVSVPSFLGLNMPYLRTRLHQINSSSDQDCSGKSVHFSGQVSNYEGFLSSNPTTKLPTSLYNHNHHH